SALHAFAIETYQEDGHSRIRFGIHPLSKRSDIEIFCTTDLIDFRMVKNSGGHSEERYVIRTPLVLGDHIWPVDITLTCRDTMLFRMLLGRTAMRNRLIVDPNESYLFGRSLSRTYPKKRKKMKRKRG
ncbi:ATP-dependent zinc protease, partial [Thermodesulfobacteriota bacterium]